MTTVRRGEYPLEGWPILTSCFSTLGWDSTVA